MAVLLPTTWYANSAGWTAVTAWAALTAKTAGQLVRQLAAPTVGNERVFICTIAGTTLAAEPTWVVTKGAKTAEAAGPTWMEVTGQPAVNGDVTNTPLSSANRSGAQVLGNIIKNNTSTHYFSCTTAGTTGAGEPTYNTTAGVTTADNTCTWTCIGAVGSFTAWLAPFARLGLGLINQNWAASGDTIYVSSSHAETQATSWTWSAGSVASPTSVLCVANGGSTPPVAADITTGASLTTTGASNMTIGGNLYFYGIAFNCGSGANTAQFLANGANSFIRFDACALIAVATTTTTFFLGLDTSRCELVNTTITCANSGTQAIHPGGIFIWRDTPSAFASTAGTWPTTIISPSISTGVFLLENVDISAHGATSIMANTVGASKTVLSKCKLPAGILGGPAFGQRGMPELDIINCDSGGVTYRHERWWYQGNQVVSATAIRTNGASNGTTAYSWQIATLTGNKWYDPFECIPVAIWNTVTGSNVIVTIEGAYNGAALPNNDDIWMDVRYLGTAASTQGSVKSNTKANVLTTPTALSASTALWGSAAPARANTTAYAVGDKLGISSASSIVRLFICTTAGTSNGSLPGGYASAVDGDSITDGTAVFRAVMRFSIAVTLTLPAPQSAGYLNAYVRVGKASSTFWIDPILVLS